MTIQQQDPKTPTRLDRPLQTPVSKLQRKWPVTNHMGLNREENATISEESRQADLETSELPGNPPPRGFIRSQIIPGVVVWTLTLAISAVIWMLIQ